jgi:hypothetical protein
MHLLPALLIDNKPKEDKHKKSPVAGGLFVIAIAFRDAD